MAPEAAEVEYPVLAKMRSSSRRALGNVSDRFDTIAKDLDNQGTGKALPMSWCR